MPFPTLPRFFTKAAANDDARLKFTFSVKDALFKKDTLYTPKTRELESNIVKNLSKFGTVPGDDVFALLPPARPTGLFTDEVSYALATHGPNVLSSSAPTGVLVLLYRATFNPFNILLTVLAIVNIATGDKATFSIMMLMVIISSSLRFWQERKSVLKASKLAGMVSSKVRVLRHPGSLVDMAKDAEEEHEIEIERSQVVPGDVLVVTSGDVFPGDVIVLTSNSLLVSQSALTGEVLPLRKRPYSHASPSKIASASDLLSSPNICLSGTSVVSGSGSALVVATGDDTYLSSIAEILRARRPINAFQAGIRRVSYLLLAFMGVMSPTVLIIKGTTSKDWHNAFLFTISVAVGLTPELLPMIVTSNLALSAVRMSAKKVIVKQLDAILNLGATTVLCSDKTGTLTLDRITLHAAVDGAGAPDRLPLYLGYVNAHFQRGTRNFLDAAILACPPDSDAEDKVLKALPQSWSMVAELPFDSSRRLLSVVLARVGEESEGLMITKGAVEEVLERCTRMYIPGGECVSPAIESLPFPGPGPAPMSSPLNPATCDILKQTAHTLNAQGLRVIGVASKPVSTNRLALEVDTEKDAEIFEENDLVFSGFLAFLDPPKPDAAEAVERLKSSGVRVMVLTGDAPAVAAKVAMDIGILPPTSLAVNSPDANGGMPTMKGVITGSALEAISGDKSAFAQAVRENVIFAKLSPYMKLQIVEAMRAQNETVAFLGDGVNDTMALRGADVGISVHSGTEIAKDAADVILLEKGLGVIADGVVLGRKTLVNTVKYVKMAASSNFGNVFSILSASAWLPYDPMSPLQLLVQNLLYDFSQASIPWDNVDSDTVVEPRNWDVKSILRFMIFFGPTSSVYDICVFSVNWFVYHIRTAKSPLVPLAQTHWFLEGLLTQTLIVYFLRTAKVPFLQSTPSLAVLCTTGAVVCTGIAVTFIPSLNTAFGFQRPDAMYGGYMCAFISGYMLLVQCVKLLYVRLFNEWI